jgi:hypothetical protein
MAKDDITVPGSDTPTHPPTFPKSPSDIVDVYKPDSEAHIANILRKSLNKPEGCETITSKKGSH